MDEPEDAAVALADRGVAGIVEAVVEVGKASVRQVVEQSR